MKRTRQVVLLLFVTIATMSWQTSLRAQAVARVGVVLSDLTEAEGHILGLPDRGVFVVDVRSDTSAARAGILARDVIFELDGGPIHGVEDFICRVSQKQPGDSVRFQILRSLKPLAITVSLGTWPKEFSLSRRSPTGCGVVEAQPGAMSSSIVDRMVLLDFDDLEVKLGLSQFGIWQAICFDRSKTENLKPLLAHTRKERGERAEVQSITRLLPNFDFNSGDSLHSARPMPASTT